MQVPKGWALQVAFCKLSRERGPADGTHPNWGVPEHILQGIDAVREANTINMFNANMVRLQAVALGYMETAEWIEANLETYCSGIFRGFAALST